MMFKKDELKVIVSRTPKDSDVFIVGEGWVKRDLTKSNKRDKISLSAAPVKDD